MDVEEKFDECSYDDFNESSMDVRLMKLDVFLRHSEEILNGQMGIEELKICHLENQ